MKLIEWLSDKIEEEIHDAECYARKALEWKDSDPDLSKTLYQISLEEMEHMNRLHKSVVAIIEDYREKRGDPPAGMQTMYDILHRRHIDAAASVKSLQLLYKEQ